MQEAGYVLRNGVALRSTKSPSDASLGHNPRKLAEDLAIHRNGTFEIFDERTVDLQTFVDKEARQVFSFGPGLVKNGQVAVVSTYSYESCYCVFSFSTTQFWISTTIISDLFYKATII